MAGYDLPIGFYEYDASDARGHNADGSPGSGVGYAPVTARFPGSTEQTGGTGEFVEPDLSYRTLSPEGEYVWGDPSDARHMNAERDPGSGGWEGAPPREWLQVSEAGYEAQIVGPLDDGMTEYSSPRDGLTPSRMPLTRWLYITEPWFTEISGDFIDGDRELIGGGYNGAQQPYGRMNPMDEYRLLSDGSHA